MIPTIEQVMRCYRVVAQTERMKTGRPGEETVANALRGATNVCRSAGVELTAPVTALTRKKIDRALATFMVRGLTRLSAWSYVCQLRGVFAKWCKPYYDDAGWYDESEDELAIGIVFNAGEGFDVQAGSACSFQYSGEVNMAETDIPFRKNLSAQGNIRPSSVNIQDIIPVDGEDEYIGDGDITIQFYGALGALDAQYAYYGKDEYDDDMPAGWYDESEDELASYTFQPGEGFKIQAGQAGYLRFPEL